MRVLVVCGAGYLSGKEKITLALMKELRRRGHTMFCVTTTWGNGDFVKLLEQEAIPHKRLALGFISKTMSRAALVMTLDQLRCLPGLWYGYRKVLNAFKPDAVIHSTYHHLILLYLFLDRNRDVYHVHDGYTDSQFYRNLLRFLSKRLRFFIAVSDYIKGNLVQLGVSEKKVVTVHNGIEEDINPYDGLHRANEDVVSIGIVGQIAPWKGHDDLIEALYLLKQGGICKYECRVFGAGEPAYIQALKQKAARYGVEHLMQWKGFEYDLNRIYAPLDICVVPSRFDEPFGLSAIEPAFWNIPVIATHKGGLPESIVDGETGFLVDAASPDQLADKLRALIEHPQKRSEMGEAARERSMQFFTLKQMGMSFDHLLQDLQNAEQQGADSAS